jgi:hypothetical protein
MTASERSFLGLAKQTAKGTPNVTDAEFKYFLFRAGGVAPNNMFLPLDQEIGGGAMLRDVVKVGITSGGTMDIIPRPTILGDLLLGAIGNAAAPVDGTDGSWSHVFTLPTDEFDAPYWTLRSAPGGIWAEQLQDCRVAGLVLSFTGARFVEGAATFVGGLPTPNIDGTGWVTAWAVPTYLDAGPQFLSPVSDIELPSGTPAKVLSGAIAMGLQIPLDEQFIVGSYSPDDFDINQRSYNITLNLKVDDVDLYEKIMYDPAGSAAAWTAAVFKEGDMKLDLISPELAGTSTGGDVPYSLEFDFDVTDDNIVWSAAPIALRAGRQVVMQVTGTVINSANEPITATLTNAYGTQY